MIDVRKITHLPVQLAPYLRMRHVRGHGIHSPFVYGIIRNALIFGKGFSGPKDLLYTFLRTIGVGRRSAMQLQNLHNYCEYGRTVIHYGTGTHTYGNAAGPVLRIFTGACPTESIETLRDIFQNETGTVAVISPRSTKERARICRTLSAGGECISIDNRGFMLYFYKSGRPGGHYKL